MTLISWLIIGGIVAALVVVGWRFWVTRYRPVAVEENGGIDPARPLPTDLRELVEIVFHQTTLARKESALARHALERRVLNMEKLLFGFAVLIAAFGIVAVLAVSASHSATEANNRQTRRDMLDANSRCLSGNETRAAVVSVGFGVQAEIDGILNGFAALSPTTPQTAQEKTQAAAAARVIKDNRDAFLAKLGAPGLQPRDCDKLYPLPKGTT